MIFLISILLVIAYIVLFTTEKIRSYLALSFYRKQGVLTIFNLFNGFSKYTTAEKGSNDQFGVLKSLYMEKSEEELLVFNQSRGTKSLVLLLGRSIISEFFKNEFKFSTKVPLYQTVDFGFIDHGGPEAIRKKGLFKQFFDQENLEFLVPKIHEIVKEKFSKLEKASFFDVSDDDFCDKDEFKKIEFSKISNEIFSDIIEFLVLGHDSEIKFRGKRMTSLVVEGLVEAGNSKSNFLNSLLGGKLVDYGLLPASNRAHNSFKEIEEEIYRIYLERKQDKNSKEINLNLNIIDLIIQDDTEWTKEQIVSNLVLFFAAGSDTAIKVIDTFAHYLAGQKSLQKEIFGLVKKK